jgi:hypothetical protein
LADKPKKGSRTHEKCARFLKSLTRTDMSGFELDPSV